MKTTFRILFYLKRDKPRKNGNFPINCRITINGTISQFSTKVEIDSQLWDVKASKAIGRPKDVSEINMVLDGIKASIYKIYHNLQEKDNFVNAEKVRNTFLGIGSDDSTYSLMSLFEKHNEDYKNLAGISKSHSCHQKYERAKRVIQSFMEYKYKKSDIALKDINHVFVYDLEIYLRSVRHIAQNTAAKYLQRLRKVLFLAKNNGWIVQDPFFNFKIRFERTDRGYLLQEELDAIMLKNMPSKRLEQVRDVFIFSCMTGLSFSDLAKLSKDDIKKSFDGNLWIMIKRQKTNVPSNIPLLDIPKAILEKYQTDDKLLPVYSNQKINDYLKEIAAICGINKNISFHLARHTFSTTIALANGMPIETLSKILGHNSIKTTQIYARITDTKVSQDMNSLADKLKSAEPQVPVNNKSKSIQIDLQFECLTLVEKMKLFNLPKTLTIEPEREERISTLWHGLSENEKCSLWMSAFEKTNSDPNKPMENALTFVGK